MKHNFSKQQKTAQLTEQIRRLRLRGVIFYAKSVGRLYEIEFQ